MDTPEMILEKMIEQGQSYSSTSIQLAKLKSLEKATQLSTALISGVSVLILLALFAIVLTIGIALWLGELLGHIYYGFFTVALAYLVLGIVFHFLLYSWIKKPVSNLLINQILNSKE
jgi:hypothetical protein